MIYWRYRLRPKLIFPMNDRFIAIKVVLFLCCRNCAIVLRNKIKPNKYYCAIVLRNKIKSNKYYENYLKPDKIRMNIKSGLYQRIKGNLPKSFLALRGCRDKTWFWTVLWIGRYFVVREEYFWHGTRWKEYIYSEDNSVA